MKHFATFSKFWPYYLRAHRHPGNRALHYLGSVLAITTLVLAFVWTPWVLFALPFVGYGPPWLGHFLIEKNRPTTFGHALWSAVAEYRMFVLWMTGRLKRRLQTAIADQPAAALPIEADTPRKAG